MEITIFKPKAKTANAKLTVHKTGKLGLSKGAAELLEVEKNRYAKFGFNQEDDLFILPCQEADDETFLIGKAGNYFYINAKSLLDERGVSYTGKETVIFDLRETDEKNLYQLHMRTTGK